MTGAEPSARAPGPRRRIAAAVAVLVAAALLGAWWWLGSAPPPESAPGRVPSLFTVERDGLRYEYHAVTGAEALWDMTVPSGRRRNLARERAEDLPAFRDALRKKVGVADLEELRAPHADLAEQLRRLGYL